MAAAAAVTDQALAAIEALAAPTQAVETAAIDARIVVIGIAVVA
ncbi:MAG: hypothetical protein Q7T86_07610 [Hyphomicrobiaceae bacterium]|nr:hypothetical protein [Hyphomicrobiaceae bacterium]